MRAAPRELHPPLVVLCDISGSMNPYSRMFLHFLHAITNDRDRVTVFVFGTRLTNITRQLRHRDVDVAMAQGGRRDQGLVGRHAHRRVPARVQLQAGRGACSAQNACVLLVSDGLDREAGEGLGEEMERLAKSLPLPGVAEPAAALRQVRGAAGRRARHAAARRPLPAGA